MLLRQYFACFLLSLPAGTLAGEFEKLGLLTGHWVGGDGAYEEVWFAPENGTLAGSFRWVMPGRTVLEYLVIEQVDDEILFRFKHFNPDYSTWESEPNVYRLETATENLARFVRANDYQQVPKTLEYRREGNSLVFTGYGDVAGEPPLVLTFRLKQPSMN